MRMAAWCVPCAPPILKAVVLIGINLFRSTISKMMSCAASAGTEATSHGEPTTYCTRDFALERCGRARKEHTPVDAVMWFYGAKTAGMLVLFGCEMQW